MIYLLSYWNIYYLWILLLLITQIQVRHNPFYDLQWVNHWISLIVVHTITKGKYFMEYVPLYVTDNEVEQYLLRWTSWKIFITVSLQTNDIISDNATNEPWNTIRLIIFGSRPVELFIPTHFLLIAQLSLNPTSNPNTKANICYPQMDYYSSSQVLA